MRSVKLLLVMVIMNCCIQVSSQNYDKDTLYVLTEKNYITDSSTKSFFNSWINSHISEKASLKSDFVLFYYGSKNKEYFDVIKTNIAEIACDSVLRKEIDLLKIREKKYLHQMVRGSSFNKWATVFFVMYREDLIDEDLDKIPVYSMSFYGGYY